MDISCNTMVMSLMYIQYVLHSQSMLTIASHKVLNGHQMLLDSAQGNVGHPQNSRYFIQRPQWSSGVNFRKVIKVSEQHTWIVPVQPVQQRVQYLCTQYKDQGDLLLSFLQYVCM